MANEVIDISEKHGPQTGDLDKDVREWTRVFQVQLLNNEHGPIYAAYSGVPLIGDGHPLDPLASVRKVSISQENRDQHVYIVTVRYSTAWEQNPSPIQEVPEIIWGFAVVNKVVQEDTVTGDPIAASTGEILVPGIEQEDYRLLVRVTRNEWLFNPLTADSYIGKCNSDATTICGLSVDAKKALCRNFAGTRVHSNEWTYWRVEYEIEFNPDTFVRKVLDHGTYYLDDGGNKQIFRDGGEQATRPHLLDGSGGILSESASPVFLSYDTRYTMPFSALGLDIV